MPGSKMYPLADRALDGKLEELLRTKREAGESYATISRELTNDGIAVSIETVRQWCLDLGIAA